MKNNPWQSITIVEHPAWLWPFIQGQTSGQQLCLIDFIIVQRLWFDSYKKGNIRKHTWYEEMWKLDIFPRNNFAGCIS